MENEKITFKLLILAAIGGNILFMLWITLNGLKEHFSGTIYEKVSYVGLVFLLILNSVLLLRGRRK